MSMDKCKKDVTPLLTHWSYSYIFLALIYWYANMDFQVITGPTAGLTVGTAMNKCGWSALLDLHFDG